MATSFVVKVQYNEILRRFNTIKQDGELNVKFGALKWKICKLFEFPIDAQLSLTYVDEDGDTVTLASDEDLRDIATQNLKFLKINVSLNSTSDPKSVFATQNDAPSSLKEAFDQLSPKILDKEASSVTLKATDLRDTVAKLDSNSSKIVHFKPQDVAAKPSLLLNKPANIVSAPSETPKVPDLPRCFFGGAPFEGNSFLSGAAGRPCHDGVECDECGVNPIIGVRYKPLDAKCYDLCEACYIMLNYPPGYEKIGTSMCAFEGYPFANNRNSSVCEYCGVDPIIGARFNSLPDGSFDLCEACFYQMGDPTGFQKVETNVVNTDGSFGGYHFDNFVDCYGCGAPARYISKMEFDDTLCEACFSFVSNPECYEIIETPDFSRPFDYGEGFRKSKLESRFIDDVTVPDGTLISPGAIFRKIWRLRNNGSVRWPRGTCLTWIGGDKLTDTTSVQLDIFGGGLPQGGEINVAVDFSAPSLLGRYVSYWKLMSPVGTKFGQRLWVNIRVDDSARGVNNMNFDLNVVPERNPINPTWSNLGSYPRVLSKPVRINEGIHPIIKGLGLNEVDPNIDAEELRSLLTELEEMGFSDKEKNLKLLKKHNGSITGVVMDMLSK